jgi:hypothetical protein
VKAFGLLLAGLFGIAVLGLPLLVVAVVATHPWLAAGAFVRPDGEPTAVPAVSAPRLPALDVVEAAAQWLRVPYVYGGCSRNGVDCSCLVMNVFRAVGVNLPRTAADQFNATTRVAREDLQPGDLVFFANTYMPGHQPRRHLCRWWPADQRAD